MMNSYVQLNQTQVTSAQETAATMAAYKNAASEVKLASEAVTAAAEEVARSAETVGQTARVFTEEVKGIRVIGQSYVDTAVYHAQFIQAATMATFRVIIQIHQDLDGIRC